MKRILFSPRRLLESLRYRRRSRRRANWVAALENSGENPLPGFAFFAGLASWMEEDIIGLA